MKILVVTLLLTNYLLAWVASYLGILQPWHMGVLVLNTGWAVAYLGTVRQQGKEGPYGGTRARQAQPRVRAAKRPGTRVPEHVSRRA